MKNKAATVERKKKTGDGKRVRDSAKSNKHISIQSVSEHWASPESLRLLRLTQHTQTGWCRIDAFNLDQMVWAAAGWFTSERAPQWKHTRLRSVYVRARGYWAHVGFSLRREHFENKPGFQTGDEGLIVYTTWVCNWGSNERCHWVAFWEVM